MHQDAARPIKLGLPQAISAATDHSDIADQLGLFAAKGKLCRVVKDKDRAIDAAETISCRLKMSGKNVVLADTRIGEESVSGFGIGPVLTGHRDGFANPF